MNILKFKTLLEFLDYFKDEATCRAHFEHIRFKDGEFCPHCNHNYIYRYNDGIRYRCASCKKDFTIKIGTIFEESKIKLRTWFSAIYLLTTNSKGISSVQLSKQLGVTQKTGWFIDHRLREVLKQGTSQLEGIFEIDETYIGGKESNKHESQKQESAQGRSTIAKTAVVGMKQRDGEVRSNVVEDVKLKTLEKFIKENVKVGSTVYTDTFLSYNNLKTEFTHEKVNHSQKEYARGDIHTNGIESFWALFKRGHYGIYHYMSKKHLQRYINEFVYRFNSKNQKHDNIFADTMSRISNSKHLSYKKLVGDTTPKMHPLIAQFLAQQEVKS